MKVELEFFRYSAHAWPAGILWNNDGATLEQCQELLDEIQWTRNLDRDDIHQTFLGDYESKVREYQEILLARQNSNL